MPGLDEDTAPHHELDGARPPCKTPVSDGDNVCNADAVSIGIGRCDFAILREFPFDVGQPADPDLRVVSRPLQISHLGFETPNSKPT